MVVLSKLVRYFPADMVTGRPLIDRIDQINKKESARGDLQVRDMTCSSCIMWYDMI